MRHTHSGKQLAGSHKVKTHLLYGSKIPLLTIYAREINTFTHTHTHTHQNPILSRNWFQEVLTWVHFPV